ncbi:MAG: tetratricopeptide repeat protein [Chloroflexi bacterium]|nr:tetratricopeptide repeat protein [Chloroflexota bacterium]
MNETFSVPASSIEERVAQLAFELESALRFDRGAIILAVYRSEWVREEAAQLLAGRLQKMGQQVLPVSITPQHPDLPGILQERANRAETVYFVSGIQFGGGKEGRNVYRALNIRREYFIEYRLRVVFWLTEAEEIALAQHAPDFWAFRHRVLVFLDIPPPSTIQERAKGIALRDWDHELLRPDTAQRIQWRQQLLAELPDSPETAAARGELLFTLASLYSAQAKYTQAQPLFEEAITVCEQIGDSRGVAVTQSSLADLLTTRGQYDEAERLYKESLAVCEQIGDSRGVAVTQSSLADLLRNQKRFDEAELFYQSSLAITQAIKDLQGTAVILQGLGQLALDRDQPEKAVPLLQEARERFLAIGLGNWAASVEKLLAQIEQNDRGSEDLLQLVRQARNGDETARKHAWEMCNELGQQHDPSLQVLANGLRHVLFGAAPETALANVPTELRQQVIAVLEAAV